MQDLCLYAICFMPLLLYFFSNGPEWWRLRSSFQRDLSRVSSVRAYLPNTNTVLKEFIHHIEDDYMHSVEDAFTYRKGRDFLDSLSSLFLECK